MIGLSIVAAAMASRSRTASARRDFMRWQPGDGAARAADGRDSEYFVVARLHPQAGARARAQFLAMAQVVQSAQPAMGPAVGPVLLHRPESSYLLVHESDHGALQSLREHLCAPSAILPARTLQSSRRK